METKEIRGTTFSMPTDTTLVAVRAVDAPRQLVWDVHTMCEHLQRWLVGPEGWSMPT